MVHFNPETEVYMIDKSLYAFDNHAADTTSPSSSGTSTPSGVSGAAETSTHPNSSNDEGASTPPNMTIKHSMRNYDAMSILSETDSYSSRITNSSRAGKESTVSHNSAFRMASNVAKKFKRKHKGTKSGDNSIANVDDIG